MGAEPLLQVALPPALPLEQLQLHTFPPPERRDTSTQIKENIVPGNCVPDRVRRGELAGVCVDDLTPIDVTHACGHSCLLHFSGGVNMLVSLDLHEHVELVSKSMHALQAVMEPPHYRTLLQGYYRYAPQWPWVPTPRARTPTAFAPFLDTVATPSIAPLAHVFRAWRVSVLGM